MKNAVLPSVSSSELYSFASNEAIYDVPLHIDNIGCFCTQYDQELDGGFSIPSQSQTAGANSVMTIQGLDYPYLGEGYLTTTSNNNNSNYDCIIHPDQHPFLLTNNLSSLPQHQQFEFQAMENPKKRHRTEINKNITENGYNNNNNLGSNISGMDEWTRMKKRKTSMDFKDHQWSFEEEGRILVHRDKVPTKRSQKLSDKITVLQKLVSPYGKTDTASVLEEAFVSIKFLQDQIQNLCDMMKTSNINIHSLHPQKTEETQLDLRSRGLCLVPLSFCSETEEIIPI